MFQNLCLALLRLSFLLGLKIYFPLEGRRPTEHILDEAAYWVCNGWSTFAVKELQKFLMDFIALATKESHQILFISYFAILLYSRLVAHF